jgi:hypothetical protein
MQSISAMGISMVSALQLDPTGTIGRWRDSRPVFLLNFKDGSKLVVKAEIRSMIGKSTPQSVQWGGHMMKQVSNPIEAAALTETEMRILRNLGVWKYCNGQIGERTREYLIDLMKSGLFSFFKMPFLANLRALDTMLAKNRGAKVLAKLRNDRSVLVGLGQIVAVDLFIGNGDRFGSTGRVVNEGNVIFQKNADKTYTPVGLDFFQAQGQAANLYKAPPDDWAGVILGTQVQSSRLTQFATNAIDSLNEVFANALAGTITAQDLMSSICIGRFTAGLREGAATLQAFLRQKMDAGERLPSGVVTRMALLGWADPNGGTQARGWTQGRV